MKMIKVRDFWFFRGVRYWSDRRWANTPKWLRGVDLWLMDSLGYGGAHCGWMFNPRCLMMGVSWEIVSANWIGTRNELVIRIHLLPMLTLYITYLIPERWIKREIGTSLEVAGYFRH